MSQMSSMATFPLLTTLGLIPLVGAVVLVVLRNSAAGRAIALAFSLVTLGLAIVLAVMFDRGSSAQFQFAERHDWIPQFGVSYALGVDGMALALIVMAAILVPICIVAAWNDIPEGGPRQNTYFAWMLLLETFIVGVFAATDVFLFYVFFEAMLVPVYFLIGSYGGARRHAAAMKFLLFSLAGGLIMLVAVIGLYFQGPRGNGGFLLDNLTGLQIPSDVQNWLFIGFFIAFAVKAPMWPVHTWLPDAAEQSRPATAVLLVGVLDKVGTYGMIRFCLQLFPESSQWATPVVLTLALISIIYGAVLAIGSQDMMRLIAFTSISHFGFIVMGIFAFTHVATAGSILYMVNHGFSTAALFLIAGMLITRGGSQRIADYGGWQRVTPVLAGCFLVSGLSGLALPGMGSFVSEFLVMMGTFQRYPWVAVISSVGIILAALYILLLYQRVFTGPPPGTHVIDVEGAPKLVGPDGQPIAHDDEHASVAHAPVQQGALGTEPGEAERPAPRVLAIADLNTRERWVMAPLIALFLLLGFFPKLALDYIDPAVTQTLTHVGVTDPAPAVGAVTGSAQ
nr:NADH-quinone oxidoreductase subunit M [Kineosphaera limosa]